MKAHMRILTISLAVAVACLMALPGCETTSSEDTVLSVSPSTATLSGNGATATFTAASAGSNVVLQLPLVWTVSDANLGIIKSSAGMTAVYESKGAAGNNVVTVRDQGDAEGMALVNQ